jgi:hypothetical protein
MPGIHWPGIMILAKSQESQENRRQIHWTGLHWPGIYKERKEGEQLKLTTFLAIE